ncbi:RNA-directed DNA polymerase from mobile element jockey [Pitangus sulphuratus]|nr:RNA-directed DNA polymerase from mobile element jockey [Pitangus sulphuratus]
MGTRLSTPGVFTSSLTPALEATAEEKLFREKVEGMDDGQRCSKCPELEDHDRKNYQPPVSPETVWDLLFQLDYYNFMEPDGIHPIIIEDLVDVITKHLSLIFKLSWESGEVPTDWKLVNIVSIFKKGK